MAERVKPYKSGINYWVFATDPDEYSYQDLERDTATVWNGVTDYASLKHLRDVETDEEVFIFHTGTELAIVGIARIGSDPYPNPEGNSRTRSWWTSSPCGIWRVPCGWPNSRTFPNSRTSTW